MAKTDFRIIQDSQKLVLGLDGNWDFQTPIKNLKALKKTISESNMPIEIDFANTSRIDFIFSFFLSNALQETQKTMIFKNASKKILNVLQSQQNLPNDFNENLKKRSSFFKLNIFNFFGREIIKYTDKTLDFINFTGMGLYFLFQTILSPSKLRFNSLFYHINESGFKALPVSILTAFIVGAAISLQGAMQLQNMGVPLMSIDTTAKLSLREMGPFVLALVIAGRSSSSFTAQIGVMKITEELDAMKTMNFNVYEFLVIPRILALIIVMPLLVFLADAFALFGGMLAIKYQLGISFGQYIDRFYETVGWNHFWVGMIKAPFFGWAIAMVGCFRGFEVKGDTESVGRLTTISVVNALFWIIFINALFSIIFTELRL